MIATVIIYFVIYTLGLALIVWLGLFLQVRRERQYKVQADRLDASEVVVMIPFRNERDRISVLLDSIKGLSKHPGKYIFIDDHSTDDTDALIFEKLKGFPCDVMILPNEITGKKRALRYAISHTTAPYILTWDADVYFSPDYFINLEKLGKADMYVLPAILEADNYLKRFFEIDVVLVNAVNVGLSGITRPIMSSGANFLYEREAFNDADDFQSHAHAASGDDTYLLRDFRLRKKTVRLISDRTNAVSTETPSTFREFIDQRLRWIGKTGDLKDNLSTSLAIGQSVMTVIYILGLIYFLIMKEWELLGYWYIGKTVTDLLLFFPFFFRIKRMLTWILIPFYELLFPIYNLIILGLLFFYKPKWKGREIYNLKS